jgi:hypothetical protein
MKSFCGLSFDQSNTFIQSKDSATALPAPAVGRASGIVGFKKFFIYHP